MGKNMDSIDSHSFFMAKLTRTVYPIGLGGFASEIFSADGFNNVFCAVYDCGSNTHGMNTRIASIIEHDIDSVDALFISHFHRDHIHQIKKLPITKETKVFIPWLFDRYILLKEYLWDMDYSSLVSWLQQNATVIFLDPIEVGNSQSVAIIEEYNPEDEQNQLAFANFSDGQHIGHILKICIQGFDWCYIPFHLQDCSVFDMFIKESLKNGITDEELEHFDVNKKTLVRKLSKIYKDICKKQHNDGNLNFSSMLLVSRPMRANMRYSCELKYDFGHLIPFDRYDYYYRHQYYQDNASCLYTGDTPLHINSFMLVFKLLMPKIMNGETGLVQIPHHGSKNGYNPDIWRATTSKFAFIHCAENPGKNQPVITPQIFFDTSRRGINLFPVSEKDDTLFREFICL